MLGPLTIEQLAELCDQTHTKAVRIAISDRNESEFVRELTAWFEYVMNEADEQARYSLVRDVGMVYETAYDRITVIHIHRDEINDVSDGQRALPPVPILDQVGLRIYTFLRLMRQFYSRLDLSFKPHSIDTI